MGKMKISPVLSLLFLQHRAFERGFLTRPSFPAPQCLQPSYLLSKCTPRTRQRQGTFQTHFFFPTWWSVWLVFRRNRKMSSWTFRRWVKHSIESSCKLHCNNTAKCPLHCAYRHSSRIEGMLKYDESMISLHKICENPMNCQCVWLSAFLPNFLTIGWATCF